MHRDIHTRKVMEQRWAVVVGEKWVLGSDMNGKKFTR